MSGVDRSTTAWLRHGSDPAWNMRKLQQAIRRLIRRNHFACPVCTAQAEWHTPECPFGWVLGGPDHWRQYDR